METIKNECLEVSFNLHAGSLTSIKNVKTGEEYLYQKDPRSWQGQDIAIFPFIARLKNKTYTVDGVSYSMDNHGLIRYNDLEVVSKSENKETLRFMSNEETLKKYPYKFAFEITYTLSENKLTVEYDIYNIDDKTIYFGLGAHPAIKVSATEKEDETDISKNTVLFDKEEDLTLMTLTPDGAFITGEEPFGKTDKIELSKQLFQKYNTIIIKANDIRHIKLLRNGKSEINYYFDNANYYAIWSHPHFGDYVCVEPWMSLPDYNDAPSEFKEKKALVSLKQEEKYHFSYSIKF